MSRSTTKSLMSITESRDRAIGTVKPLDDYSHRVVCIQTRRESGRVQTHARSRSAVTIDLRRPSCWQLKNITLHQARNMSVDNLAGGQWTTLSTAEPGTPLVSTGHHRRGQTRRNTCTTRQYVPQAVNHPPNGGISTQRGKERLGPPLRTPPPFGFFGSQARFMSPCPACLTTGCHSPDSRAFPDWHATCGELGIETQSRSCSDWEGAVETPAPPTSQRKRSRQHRIRQLRRSPAESLDFEHVHLPDDGQEFLKPTEDMLLQDLLNSPSKERDRALAHFRNGDELFSSWRYREAADAYEVSGQTAESPLSFMARGVALTMVSDLRNAANAFEEASGRARTCHAVTLEAALGINIAQVHRDLGRAKSACRILESTRALCHSANNTCLEGLALRHLGAVLLMQELYDDAVACCDSAIQQAHYVEDRTAIGHSLCSKGAFLAAKGDLHRASAVFKHASSLAQREDPTLQGRIHINLANLHLARRNFPEALHYSDQALTVHRRSGYRQGEARNLSMRAVVRVAQGVPLQDLRAYKRAIDLDRGLNYRKGVLRTELTIAKTQVAIGDTANALTLLASANHIAEDIGHMYAELESSVLVALLAPATELQDKIHLLEHSLTKSTAAYPLLATQILSILGTLYGALGLYDKAVDMCRQALARSKDSGNLLEGATASTRLARIHTEQGRMEDALECTSIADAIFASQGLPFSNSPGLPQY